MSDEIITGGAAFPIAQAIVDPQDDQSGMSLRDYFAAKAIQGMISSNHSLSTDYMVDRAYRIADEMLKRRKS